MDLQSENAEAPIEDDRVQRAVALLLEALGIIDDLASSPEAGARLDEVITIVRKIRPQSVTLATCGAEEMTV